MNTGFVLKWVNRMFWRWRTRSDVVRDEAAPLCLQHAAGFGTLDKTVRSCCFKMEGQAALKMNFKELELERLIYDQCQN